MDKLTSYGIVYVLTNPAMPDLVKIGMTDRDSVDARLKELFNTSVPVPFECEFACKVSNCRVVEKALHLAFEPYKIHSAREFFKISPEQAIAILKLLDESNDITNEIKEELGNDLTCEDKEARNKLKVNRRPSLNFREMGIPLGAKLDYTRGENDIFVEVCSDKKINYYGLETSLTAITKELLGLDYTVSPGKYWTYNGRSISDIYNETYTLME